MDVEQKQNNSCSPKSLAQSSARLRVRGSVLDLARGRLELDTTFLGLCSASDWLRELLEAG